jgi:uncharacterized RDD family membrane protein YckC
MSPPPSASLSYLTRRDKRALREVVTPEGIPLRLALATAGDRANAFLLDFLIITLVVVVVTLLAAVAGAFSALGLGEAGSGFSMAFALLVSFLLRNFYFMWFELRWQGRTPGKRVMGIRVIDAHGGALSTDAIAARNLTRDLEVFLPLAAVFAPDQLWPDGPGWARLLAGGWLVVFAFMPLFNKDRLRIGDLIGGTLVVLAPKAVLLPDLADRPAAPAGRPSAAPAAAYAFEQAQLDVYGVYELQVLEDVLRQDQQKPNDLAIQTVCEKIKTKIGWRKDAWQVEQRQFLRDFYAATRARLEQKMLFGKRKEDKFSKSGRGPGLK